MNLNPLCLALYRAGGAGAAGTVDIQPPEITALYYEDPDAPVIGALYYDDPDAPTIDSITYVPA